MEDEGARWNGNPHLPKNNSVPRDRQYNKQGTCLGLGDILKANSQESSNWNHQGPYSWVRHGSKWSNRENEHKCRRGRQESVNRSLTAEGRVPVMRKKEIWSTRGSCSQSSSVHRSVSAENQQGTVRWKSFRAEVFKLWTLGTQVSHSITRKLVREGVAPPAPKLDLLAIAELSTQRHYPSTLASRTSLQHPACSQHKTTAEFQRDWGTNQSNMKWGAKDVQNALRSSSNSSLNAQGSLCTWKQAAEGGGVGPGSLGSGRRLWRSIPQGSWLCAPGRWLWAARLWKHSPGTHAGTDLRRLA